MKREYTNAIRYVMDELVPPVIRDSAWFMWPFYVAAYRTLNVQELMRFKTRVYSMTPSEYEDFYAKLGNSVSRNRITDLNEACTRWIIERLPSDKDISILDVGAGNGYLLSRLSGASAEASLTGVDLAPPGPYLPKRVSHVHAALPDLPFEAESFRAVTCTHVLEHVLDVRKSITELLRVTKERLYVVVPRQRYYFYTLDEHVNFYPQVEPLVRLFEPYKVQHELVGGDWALMIDKSARYV